MGVIRHIVVAVLFTLFCVAVFGLLEWLMPIDDHQPPITRRKGLKTNLWFWFLSPYWDVIGQGLVIITFLLFVALVGWEPTKETITAGFGPMAKLPIGWQIPLALIPADIAGYWTHRYFHSARLWKFHAVHHSPTELDWLAAARLHPVNEIANKFAQAMTVLLLGFPPLTLAAWGIVFLMWNLLIHANLNWTFGWPLKYVFASPVFHRWHHTTDAEAQGKNFAGMFPFVDMLFGTFYMPKGKLPLVLGIGDEKLPDGYIAQCLYPFRKPDGAAASAAPAAPAQAGFDAIAAAALADQQGAPGGASSQGKQAAPATMA